MAEPRRGARHPQVFASLILSLLVAIVVGSQARGLISSNDGSHVALARALWLRGTAQLGEDCSLTLAIDFAERDGACYSDRPPGTALLAGPAILAGEALAPAAIAWSREAGEPRPLPAVLPYMQTYNSRSPDARPLARLIGTALTLAIHGVIVLLIGLHAWSAAVVRMGVESRWATFVALVLGTCTLWSCYSTTLFSHNTTASLIAVALLFTVKLHEESSAQARPQRPHRDALALGTVLGLAVACEYALVFTVCLWSALCIPRRLWPAALGGALPPALALGTYHTVAFGAPWRTGYGAQGHFEFTHSTHGLLGGSLVQGVWTQWGAGANAGVLAMSPILVLALVGWVGIAFAWRQTAATSSSSAATASVPIALTSAALAMRLALACLPYLVLVALQPSPGGGEGSDYRYLVPIVPVLALGLVLPMSAASKQGTRVDAAIQPLGGLAPMGVIVAGCAALAGLSAWWTWQHFWAWQEAVPFASPWVGGVAVVAALLLETRWLLVLRSSPQAAAEDFGPTDRRVT